jgi:hypothetical protein
VIAFATKKGNDVSSSVSGSTIIIPLFGHKDERALMTCNDLFDSDRIKHFDRLNESFTNVNQDSNILTGRYDHTKFNEAIEILVKMLDRLDRFDSIFAQ